MTQIKFKCKFCNHENKRPVDTGFYSLSDKYEQSDETYSFECARCGRINSVKLNEKNLIDKKKT